MKKIILAVALMIMATGIVSAQVDKEKTEAEQLSLDSICSIRGHVYEQVLDTSAFLKRIGSVRGIIKTSNFHIGSNQNIDAPDSFKILIDAPDSSYFVWRYEVITKRCYRCLRYIPQPLIPDRYINTIWRKP